MVTLNAFLTADNFPLPPGVKPVRDETPVNAELRWRSGLSGVTVCGDQNMELLFLPET